MAVVSKHFDYACEPGLAGLRKYIFNCLKGLVLDVGCLAPKQLNFLAILKNLYQTKADKHEMLTLEPSPSLNRFRK